MPRNAVPSLSQQEKLLDCLEQQRWLAVGYARSNHARERNRTAWQQISNQLNSDGQGCIKSSQQWTKYWTDKKSAVKKKYSQICMTRRQTGGGAAEEIVLSPIEERILALMGGPAYARGDRELEINQFPSRNSTQAASAISSLQTQAGIQLDIQEIQNIERDSGTTVSDNIFQVQIDSVAVEPGSEGSVDEQRVLREPQPSTSANLDIIMDEPLPRRNVNTPQASTPEPDPAATTTTSTPRRRRRTEGRRRVAQRTPPSQRRSQLTSVTERFIAIEEQRVATERILARNQQELIRVLGEMSAAWHRQSEAIIELVHKINP